MTVSSVTSNYITIIINPFSVTAYFNSLAPVRYDNYFPRVITKHMLWIKVRDTCEIVLRWIPLNTIDNRLTLAQIVAWCPRLHAVTWANIDQDLCHHMASLGHNELMLWVLNKMVSILQTIFSNYAYSGLTIFCIWWVTNITMCRPWHCCFLIAVYIISHHVLTHLCSYASIQRTYGRLTAGGHYNTGNIQLNIYLNR